MTYIGNRLASYCDSEQFIYDSNGNCCFDPTTGLEYSYNFLNLPCTVFDGEEMQLQYTYFADGTSPSSSMKTGNNTSGIELQIQ